MPLHNRYTQSQFFCSLLSLENQLNMQHSFKQGHLSIVQVHTRVRECCSALPLGKATATVKFIRQESRFAYAQNSVLIQWLSIKYWNKTSVSLGYGKLA